MRLFQSNPTIKETSTYLQETVDQLLKKHGSVSNPDFEKELIETTGIAYKQVKNYKNHPKPSQIIKDNAIVIKFVREKRRQNWRKIYAIRSTKLLIVILAIICVWHFWPKSPPGAQKIYVVNGTPIETPASMPPGKESELRISFRVPKLGWQLRLGELSESKFDEGKFKCSAIFGTKQMRCKHDSDAQAPISVSYLKEGSIIQQISLSSYNSDFVNDLESQAVSASKGLHETSQAGRSAKVFRSNNEVLMFEKSEWKSKSPPLKLIVVSLRLDI